MRRLLTALTVLLFAACGGDSPTGMEPGGEIVDLVLDADSITFVQGGVDLTESLYGVTSEGDTVYNPDGVTFDLPAGFTRDGDVLRATREASGTVVAELNPADSVQMRAVQHLDSLAPWSFGLRCYYDTGESRRPSDGEWHRVDSLIYTASIDSVGYVDKPHHVPIRGYGSGTAYYYWDDGVVDTARYDGSVYSVEQSAVDTITDSAIPIPATRSTPRRYARPDSACAGYGYDSTGVYRFEEI